MVVDKTIRPEIANLVEWMGQNSSPAALAAELGISESEVSLWFIENRLPPSEYRARLNAIVGKVIFPLGVGNPSTRSEAGAPACRPPAREEGTVSELAAFMDHYGLTAAGLAALLDLDVLEVTRRIEGQVRIDANFWSQLQTVKARLQGPSGRNSISVELSLPLSPPAASEDGTAAPLSAVPSSVEIERVNGIWPAPPLKTDPPVAGHQPLSLAPTGQTAGPPPAVSFPQHRPRKPGLHQAEGSALLRALGQWIEDKGTNRTAVARSLGIYESTIRRWYERGRVPRKMAPLIYQLIRNDTGRTNGTRNDPEVSPSGLGRPSVARLAQRGKERTEPPKRRRHPIGIEAGPSYNKARGQTYATQRSLHTEPLVRPYLPLTSQGLTANGSATNSSLDSKHHASERVPEPEALALQQLKQWMAENQVGWPTLAGQLKAPPTAAREWEAGACPPREYFYALYRITGISDFQTLSSSTESKAAVTTALDYREAEAVSRLTLMSDQLSSLMRQLIWFARQADLSQRARLREHIIPLWKPLYHCMQRLLSDGPTAGGAPRPPLDPDELHHIWRASFGVNGTSENSR